MIIRLGKRASSVDDKTTTSASAAAARSKIIVCYDVLPHTVAQRSMADSPGAASEGCCQGGEYSRAAVGVEIAYTMRTAHARVWDVRREEEELIVESPDAPAHNRPWPELVDGVHSRVLNRAGEALCPCIVWPVRATTKIWVYAVRLSRANDPSQT